MLAGIALTMAIVLMLLLFWPIWLALGVIAVMLALVLATVVLLFVEPVWALVPAAILALMVLPGLDDVSAKASTWEPGAISKAEAQRRADRDREDFRKRGGKLPVQD